MPQFRDDLSAAGLSAFVRDNGDTEFHQLPEAMGWGSGCSITTATAGSTSTPSREVLSPPGRSPATDSSATGGDGTFEDVSETTGIAGMSRGYSHGVAVGDYDNDGDPDLFVTRWNSYALYRNRGDGTFEDVTEPAGLVSDRVWPTSAAFADLDNDGDLDLYVCHYGAYDTEHPKFCTDQTKGAYVACHPRDIKALPDRLYRNDDGRFYDVTDEVGIVDTDGRGLGVVAADLDDDGNVDLYVANDTTPNYLFHNLGGLRFEEVAFGQVPPPTATAGFRRGWV